MVYPALLPLMRTPRLPVVDWNDAPADLNGLVRFAERRNLVSARVPSHFNWPLHVFSNNKFIYKNLQGNCIRVKYLLKKVDNIFRRLCESLSCSIRAFILLGISLSDVFTGTSNWGNITYRWCSNCMGTDHGDLKTRLCVTDDTVTQN